MLLLGARGEKKSLYEDTGLGQEGASPFTVMPPVVPSSGIGLFLTRLVVPSLSPPCLLHPTTTTKCQDSTFLPVPPPTGARGLVLVPTSIWFLARGLSPGKH